MRHFRKIAFFAIILLLATSCSDFLDEKPTAHLSTSTYYQTAEQARRAMNAVYTAARPQSFFAFYYKIVTGDIMSDNAAKGGGGAGDAIPIQQLKLFSAKSDNSYVQNAWQFNYHGIYLANLVLQKVPPVDMDPNKRKEILAEARFFRGYYYLQLERLFGNVPIVKKPLKNGEYDQPQASPDEVWDQIEQDADSAAMFLPTASELTSAQQGRVTKGAAQSLLLNVYMQRQKWSEAQQLADQIIKSGEYSLDPDYQHMWTQDGEFGPGSIFELNMANIPGKGTGTNVNLWEMPRKSTFGYGFGIPTQDLSDAFEQGDPRRDVTIMDNNETLPDGSTANTSQSPTGYYTQKYWLSESQWPQNNGGSVADGPTNERIYRLAVIMLWGAEASYHNDNIPHATNLVNKVRKRARKSGGNQDNSVLTDYDSVTLENIYREERVEQALGGHRRFYNLVRTGRAANRLKNYQQYNQYLPIPLREIQLSDSVLTQNLGYKQ